MADSTLLKISRAMQDARFTWRVAAAMHLKAQGSWNSGTTSGNFAKWILLNPQAPDPSMIALVASNPAVAAAITLDGEVADTDEVTDAAIQAAVEANWVLVSTKYTTNPMAPAV